ncbi:MAG: DUF4190 domain-containing protein [Dehalococcoidia bacterium]|nr:DUF4190 domain-containing protein [Dehalococcoidia bacterium]
MFCSKCGTQTTNDSLYCSNCGNRLAASTAATQPPAAGTQTKRTNSMAIASLALGIIGFVIPIIITSILAIIFGIVGMNNIKNNPNQEGKGLAIAGIILGAAFLVLFILILIVFPTIAYTTSTFATIDDLTPVTFTPITIPFPSSYP